VNAKKEKEVPDLLEKIDLSQFAKEEPEKDPSPAKIQRTGYVKGHLDGFKDGYEKGKDEWWEKGYDEGKEDPREHIKEAWEHIKRLLESGYRLGFWINFDETDERNGLEVEVRPLRPYRLKSIPKGKSKRKR
jgi:hypothetical protein